MRILISEFLSICLASLEIDHCITAVSMYNLFLPFALALMLWGILRTKISDALQS